MSFAELKKPSSDSVDSQEGVHLSVVVVVGEAGEGLLESPHLRGGCLFIHSIK
jgi:hypothetical protein